MGATNTTVNYNLSQFIGSDKPAWLQDYNGDMLKIDTAINTAKLAADSASNAAGAAQNDATTALGDIATINGTLTTINTTLGTAVGNINTINSLIGNGTPTTTDQTIIGAINELHANQGDLSNLTTSDQSSLVAAINEVAGGGSGVSISEKGSHLFASVSTGTSTNIVFDGSYTNPPLVIVSESCNSTDSPSDSNKIDTIYASAVTNAGFTLNCRSTSGATNIRVAYIVISTD